MNEIQRGVKVRSWKAANHLKRVQAKNQKRKSDPRLTQPHQGSRVRGGADNGLVDGVSPPNNKKTNPTIRPNSTRLNNPKTIQEKGAWVTVEVVGGNSRRGASGCPEIMNPRKGSPSKHPGRRRSLIEVGRFSRIGLCAMRHEGLSRKKEWKT